MTEMSPLRRRLIENMTVRAGRLNKGEDGALEVGHGSEHATPNGPLGQQCKEPLDLVDP